MRVAVKIGLTVAIVVGVCAVVVALVIGRFGADDRVEGTADSRPQVLIIED